MHILHHRFQIAALALALVLPCAGSANTGEELGPESWVANPYVGVDVRHESNPHKTSGETDGDTFVEPEVGVWVRSANEVDPMSLQGNAFLTRRTHASEKELDVTSFGECAVVRYGDEEPSRIVVSQGFRRTKDDDRHADDIEPSGSAFDLAQDIQALSELRDVLQLGLLLEQRVTDKTDLELRYSFCGSRHDDVALLDVDEHLGQTELGYRATDKTAAFCNAEYGLQHQEGLDDPAHLAALRLGARTLESDKLTYRVAGGLQRYTRLVGVNDEGATTLNVKLSAGWSATEKIQFACDVRNGTQLASSYEGNALDYVAGSVRVGYRWTPETTLSVSGTVRRDDYLDAVVDGPDLIDRRDTRVEGRVRVDYAAPSNALQVYAEALYAVVDTNLRRAEYDETRMALGMTLRY